MAGTNNSNATGGAANVNVNTDGGKDANVVQSLLSFAMDIPRVVRSTTTVWGIVLLLAIIAANGAVYWNLNDTVKDIRESQERIEKSLVNMHDKYNRIIRYVQTGDIDNFSKSKRDD